MQLKQGVLHNMRQQWFLIVMAVWLGGLTACVSTGESDTSMDVAQLAMPEYLKQQDLLAPNWAQLFEAPELQGLIDEAISNNPDWQAIAARVQASKAIAMADGRWPSLDLTVDNQRSDNNGVVTDTASAALRLNWEVDLWGRLSQQKAVNEWAAKASISDAQWARFSLSASVSKAWFGLLSSRQQLLLNQQRQQNLQQSLDLVEDGFSQGTREALDLYSARAELASGEASLSQAHRVFQQSRLQLNRLLGRYPGQSTEVNRSLPSVTELPKSQLSSRLLERRPDVRAAQFNLSAQQARHKLAQKNRLPVFSLSARAGYASNSLADVAQGNNPFWTALGNITAPLFKGKALAAQSESQKMLYQAAVADFKSAALDAFQEALATLNNEATLFKQWQAAQQAASISKQAEQQAMERYLSGLENFNTWLQSQRTAFDRSLNALELQAQLLQNRIDLYLALGGQWQTPSDLVVTIPKQSMSENTPHAP